MLSKLSIGQTSEQTGGQLVEVNRVNLSINRLWDVPFPLEETQHRRLLWTFPGQKFVNESNQSAKG